MLGDQLLEAGLVDRDLAALEALDLVGVDVDAPDLVAELGEAGRGDEADVAGADDADGFALQLMWSGGRLVPSAPDAASATARCRASAGWSAIASSVFETQ